MSVLSLTGTIPLVNAADNDRANGLINEKIPNQYIILLNDSVDETIVNASAKDAKTHGADVLNIYSHAVKGFVIKVPNDQVLGNIVKNNPQIAFFEQDQKVQAFSSKSSAPITTSFQTLPKGINRVDG